MMGYRTIDCENVHVRPNRRTRMPDVPMESAVIELEAVVIKAERPLIEKDVTGSSFKVSEEDLDRLPITSFVDVLPLQAGVTGEGNVRGGKSSEVLYLLDGMPVQDVLQGGVGVQLPSGAVSEMELQTGGFDSEYGNALSGVVNMVTKSGENAFEGALFAETDDFPGITQKDRYVRAEGEFGGPILKDRMFFFLSGSAIHTDTRWWQDLKHAFSPPFSREYSGFAKVDVQFGSGKRLTMQSLVSRREWYDYEFSWRYNLEALPQMARESIWGALAWSHSFSKKSFYTFSLNFSRSNQRIGEGSKTDVDLTPYQYDYFLQFITGGSRSWWMRGRQDVLGMRGELTSGLSRVHFFKCGFDIRFYDIRADIVKYEPQMTYFGKPVLDAPLLNYSTSYEYFPKSGSAYVQDKIQFTDDGGNISLGLRYDFLDPRAERPLVEWVPIGEDEYGIDVKNTVRARFKNALSPRFGMSLPGSDVICLFANIGLYTQFPTFHYLYAGLDNVTLRSGMNVLKGNPDLKPETNLSTEFSLKHILRWNCAIAFTVFSKQTKNQIDAKTFIPSNSRVAGDYGFAEYVNNDKAEARGVEVVFSRDRGRWITGSFSWTWMSASGLSSTAEQGIQYFQWGFPVDSCFYPLSWDQRHSFKAILHFSFPWGLEADLYAEYHTPRPFTYYPSRDGFTPEYPEVPFMPNNERMNSYRMVDLQISQTVRLPFSFLRCVSVDVGIRNLFDEKNILWMDSSGRIGGELRDPGAYGPGRRTRLGLKFVF